MISVYIYQDYAPVETWSSIFRLQHLFANLQTYFVPNTLDAKATSYLHTCMFISHVTRPSSFLFCFFEYCTTWMKNTFLKNLLLQLHWLWCQSPLTIPISWSSQALNSHRLYHRLKVISFLWWNYENCTHTFLAGCQIIHSLQPKKNRPWKVVLDHFLFLCA
jgi:hypothetical protein